VRALRKGGPGRPRKYKNGAAKQRAYRQRKKRAADPRHVAKEVRYALMRQGEQAPILPDSASLWCGDFRTVGAQIPDHSVALVLCDPPYGAEWLPDVEPFGVCSEYM
jgi:hypothetical protein